jgi:hypothetical protein
MEKMQSGGLRTNGREVSPSGLKPNSQTALRAVGPLSPPAPCSPGQSPGGEGGPSGCRVLLLMYLGDFV